MDKELFVHIVRRFIKDSRNADFLADLRERWIDEHEHEHWEEYELVMKKRFGHDEFWVRGVKRPFGFEVKADDYKAHIFVVRKRDTLRLYARFYKGKR